MSRGYTPNMKEPEYQEGPKAKEEFERTMIALFRVLGKCGCCSNLVYVLSSGAGLTSRGSSGHNRG
jgi:hypothetical protein